MEQLPEPIPQASHALSIIKDVAYQASGPFLMNKHQCESLAGRLRGIGVMLERLNLPVVNTRANPCEDQMSYPGFDELLMILTRAKDLLSEYRDTNAVIRNVFCSTENRKKFKEIHDDLDTLKSVFYLEDFEYDSESKKSAALTADADKDLKELSANLEGLVHGSEPRNATALSQIVETVKVMVSEKTDLQFAGLPSYLNIDPRFVEVKKPVGVRKQKSDLEVKDGVLVKLARYLTCEFAVKEFKSGDANWDRDELLKEVRSLMKLPHPHVVQFVAFAQDKDRCLILMELMDGDLRTFMEERKRRLPAGQRPFDDHYEELSIISQIAKGMHYLHEQQYVHGELKCSNILVRRKGDVGHIDVKISDLRSSQKLLPASAWDPERSKRQRPRWAAPEVKKYYGDEPVAPTHELLKKADTYSFGMVCFEVLTGMLPFQDIRGEELKKLIEAGDLKQKLPAELNESDLQGLIESCWASDPNDRPTFTEICHLLESITTSLQSVGSGTPKRKGNALARLARMFPKISETALGALCSGKEGHYVPIHNDHVKDGSSAVQETDSDQLDEFVRIHPTKLKLGRFIGTGASGKVYEATWLGCKFAVKKPKGPVPIGALQKEMKLLMQLRHPCIVQLVGLSSVTGASSCSMVMELMKGNLQTLMDERMKLKRKKLNLGERDDVVVPFDLEEAVYIIQRIARAMVFLHFRGVVHRDLKALNVLVPLYSDSIDVKISDFGLSEFINQESGSVKAGTTRWMAPELNSAKSMELIDLMAADVFSFAVTCFEILTGKFPFLADRTNQQDFRARIIEGHRPPLPSDLHSGLKKLVEDCWDEEPKKRPSFSCICQVLDKISEGLQCSGTS